MIIPPGHVHEPIYFRRLDDHRQLETCSCGAERIVSRTPTHVSWGEWARPKR